MQPTGAAELKIHGPAGVIPTPDGAANDGGDPHANGANGDGAEILSAADLRDLLQALRAVRAGDFSVRLATDRVGFMGKIADTLNEIVAANQSMAVAARARRAGRRAGGQDAAARPLRPHDRRLGRDGSLGQHADRRPALADHGGDARHHGGRAGRPAADRAARRGRPAAQGRVPALGHDRQHDDQAAERVHLRGDARGARGRHRRQARRAGAGPGGHRRLEGPDRERQLHGEQPDGPGPQHRRGDHRGRQRRPVEEDHRRRARRDPAAEGGHQHDGRPAALVRLAR